MRYQYDFFAPPSREPGPYLPIKIENPKTSKSIEWYGLVDTGADSCLFPSSIAHYVGHILDGNGVKSRVSCGMEGKAVTTYLHTFRIALMHPILPDTAVWESKKGRFECVVHDKCPLLLGVEDFLCFFRITIDFGKKLTILQF